MQRLNGFCLRSFSNNFARAGRRILFILIALEMLPGASFCAEPEDNTPWRVPVKVVSIISEDDQGAPLKFPSSVFYDKTMDELYVVGGGTARITLYGADYFPRISLGKGRGVDSPNGIFVTGDGHLYICQGRTAEHPARLTILNAAFFPVKEITFDQFPEAESFVPNRVSVGSNGTIYIAGVDFRGLLVLDSEGNFLHWLKPADKLWVEQQQDYSKLPKDLNEVEETDKNAPPSSPPSEETAKESQLDTEMANLPGFLRPKEKAKGEAEVAKPVGPVQVSDVVCDSEGRIFLLSEETSKVYVYTPAEEFLYSFGKKGGSSGKMSRPKSLAIDEKKKSVYVVDYMRHTILVYNLAGQFLFEFGGKGNAPRWFNFPTDLALNKEGNIIVADLFNQRVQILDVKYEVSVSQLGAGPGNSPSRQ